MKLALINSFVPAIIDGEQVIDVSSACPEVMALPPLQRMPALIEDFDRLRPRLATAAATNVGMPVAQVQLRAPVPRPGKILCGIGNYMEGVKGKLFPLNLFLKSPAAVLDPGGVVSLPPEPGVTVFHHEAELAAVIGRRVKNISVEQAEEAILGYTCFIDVSARWPLPNLGLRDKGYETFAPFGPWIVTKDEVADPQALQVRLWVDGQLRHDYNTSDMEHPVREVVAWASTANTLEPGDVIAFGTNHQGLGPMQDGELVEIEIECIGRFSVRVSDPLKRRWPKDFDPGIGMRARRRREEALAKALADSERAATG